MKRSDHKVLLCLLLGFSLLLSACGAGGTAADTSAAAEASQAPLPEGAVLVSTVDELLSAIAPNAIIVLQEGEYDLSTAADYGVEGLQGRYRWELVYGGSALVISDVPGLQLIGQGQVSLLARPRYAEVLSFQSCWDLRLEGVTLGHTTEPGGCCAGVLNLVGCDNVEVSGCRLFGCGSLGITASGCSGVAVRSSRIDSCSDGAVRAYGCRDLRLEDCELCDCGLSQEGPGGSLLFTERCVGFALVNCVITGNRINRLLQNQRSSQAALLGCRVEDNRVLETVFLLEGRSVTVDKCSFRLRQGERYYENANAVFAKDINGEDLISFDLDHMELARASYDGPVEDAPAGSAYTGRPEGLREVQVSTVDELLAAIAPDTCILLKEGVYDLSTASDYGRAGSGNYSWQECYDGYALALSDLNNLWICGAGKESTLITAVPRYAAVFSLFNCERVGFSDLTAGHSEEPGYCAGNVLDLDSCRDLSVEGCGLFGCGVIGINAFNCEGLSVRETEIYECSWSAATIDSCFDVSFEGCSIHDCDDGNDIIYLYGGSAAWNGEELRVGTHRFDGENHLGRLGGE